jgi:hypothetical protein
MEYVVASSGELSTMTISYDVLVWSTIERRHAAIVPALL